MVLALFFLTSGMLRAKTVIESQRNKVHCIGQGLR
jgi:hypothetical protein